jgi:hypothetical protein
MFAQLRLQLDLRHELLAQIAPEDAAAVDEKQRRRQEQALEPVTVRYSPAIPFCAASATITSTSRSAMPTAPTRRLMTTRKTAKRKRYMTVPRTTSSSGDTVNPKISLQFTARTERKLRAGRVPGRGAIPEISSPRLSAQSDSLKGRESARRSARGSHS